MDPRSSRNVAARVALLYAALASGWILVSDRALVALRVDTLVWLQTYKGLLFVIVTATALFFLMLSWAERVSEARLGALEAERRLGQIARITPIALVLIDVKGTVTYANPAACELFGRQESECAGRRLEELVGDDGGHAAVRLAEVLRSRGGGGIQLTEIAGRADTALAVRAAPVDAKDPAAGTIVAFTDVSDAHRAGTKIARINRVYRFLGEVSVASGRAADEQQLLEAVCSAAVEWGGFSAAMAAQPSTGGRWHHAAASGLDAAGLAVADLGLKDVASSPLATAQAIRTGEIVISNDVASDPTSPWQPFATDGRIASLASLPILSGERVIATFALASAEPGFFDA
ncbi:MAG: GAF domain-containing protein, partial [Actinomycetota bacterium]|nr:GAF domain-containing protein [Actinomycetota bacterium]